jgi:hypothetical protein
VASHHVCEPASDRSGRARLVEAVLELFSVDLQTASRGRVLAGLVVQQIDARA